MPVRTYDGLDLTNITTGYTSGPSGTDTPSVNHIGQANLEISVAGNHTDTNPGAGTVNAGASFVYELAGDLDFDAFPSIPSNALITKLEYKIDASVSAAASGSATADVLATVNAVGRADLTIKFTSLDPGDPTKVHVDFNDSSGLGPSPKNASDSGSDSDVYSRTTTIDLSSSPITKAQLVSTYSQIIFALESIAGGGINGFAAGTALTTWTFNAQASLTLTLNNFQFIVTYQSGPELVMTPSGGDVEPGEYVNVTGPNAGSLEYAAVNGDQVIPIVPKVIGPNEVEIEIPSPNPDCDDCFTDCPECDECFDACNEDLTGEACQNCMNACLDCLVDCLEDQEAGEDCQAAVNDPGPTSIVIICGTPGTQFNGSVPLGNFTILVARASGIYQLVDLKREDTLYATARDGTTYDVKIPNPNGKSGFFRS